MTSLQQEIVNRFHVSPDEADRLIGEAKAASMVKRAVLAASNGEVLAADDDFSDPEVWREEIRKRMQALEVLQEGARALDKLSKLIRRIVQAEQKLIASKTASVNDRNESWWDFQHSGWAMGGREMFAQQIFDILRNIDEPKLAQTIIDKIGFKRSIPLPADEEPPLIPYGIKPGEDVSELVTQSIVSAVKREVRAAKWYVATWGQLGGGGTTVADRSLDGVIKEAARAGLEEYHEMHVVTVDAKNADEAIEIIEADLYNGDFIPEDKVNKIRKKIGASKRAG